MGLPGVSDRVRGGGGAVEMEGEGEREEHWCACMHAYLYAIFCGKDVEIPQFPNKEVCLPRLQPHPQ
jgi:hypothetical protein